MFRRLGVPVFSPGPPEPLHSAVVFLIDGDDDIIARDFEVDVPVFTEAEWFQPGAAGDAHEQDPKHNVGK